MDKQGKKNSCDKPNKESENDIKISKSEDITSLQDAQVEREYQKNQAMIEEYIKYEEKNLEYLLSLES